MMFRTTALALLMPFAVSAMVLDGSGDGSTGDDSSGSSVSDPTLSPSVSPTTSDPTLSPSVSPSVSPTTSDPTLSPSVSPTTSDPTLSPSISPTTSDPTLSPSISPTTSDPTLSPSISPTTSDPAEPNLTFVTSDIAPLTSVPVAYTISYVLSVTIRLRTMTEADLEATKASVKDAFLAESPGVEAEDILYIYLYESTSRRRAAGDLAADVVLQGTVTAAEATAANVALPLVTITNNGGITRTVPVAAGTLATASTPVQDTDDDGLAGGAVAGVIILALIIVGAALFVVMKVQKDQRMDTGPASDPASKPLKTAEDESRLAIRISHV